MKLIVGLGNPGKRYKNTRHNIGFAVIDSLASQITNYGLLITNEFQTSKNAKAEYLSFKVGDEKIELIKPLTFMNDSGFSVVYAKNKHKIPLNNIYVIHDDLDIKLGEYKIQKGIGPHLHYGIRSVDKALGTRQYWRVRIGVENRPTNLKIFNLKFRRKIPGEKYVLQRFDNKEREIIDKVISEVAEKLVGKIKESKWGE